MANKIPHFIWAHNAMLVKTLGLSNLVYAASMLRIPEMVIKGYKKK